MHWLVVPDLRNPEIVCQVPCGHPDCAMFLRFATKTCRICGKGFEAGQRFYFEGHEPVHAVCWEEAV